MIKSKVYYDDTGVYVTDIHIYDYTLRQRQEIENEVASRINSEFNISLFQKNRFIAEVLVPSPKELDIGISKIQIFV